MSAYDLTISGSLLISGSGKFGDGSPIISSSGQLASDISGSLGTNAALIRSLTAVGITGSFTATSSSLSTRVTTNEGKATKGFTIAMSVAL